MIVALYILVALIVVGGLLRLTHDRSISDETAPVVEASDDCCGQHAVCEKFAEVPETVIYFDDEELDEFTGRESSSYTDDEIERFRDVLFTLLPSDLVPWMQSLSMRKIALPDPLRDEYLMLLADVNQSQTVTFADA